MKTSIGSTISMNIVFTFIVIIFAFVMAALSYYKAYKVNNIIADSITPKIIPNMYKEIIEDMRDSQFLERIWEMYKEENTYSEGIMFADTLDNVLWIGKELEKY